MSTAGNQNTNDLTAAVNGAVVPAVAVVAPAYKIRFAIKLVAFFAATIALSWFFEGWRQVSDSPTVAHCAVLFGGTLATISVVGLMSYWTYFEEKSKGTLKKKVALFEGIRENLQARKLETGEKRQA